MNNRITNPIAAQDFLIENTVETISELQDEYLAILTQMSDCISNKQKIPDSLHNNYNTIIDYLSGKLTHLAKLIAEKTILINNSK